MIKKANACGRMCTVKADCTIWTHHTPTHTRLDLTHAMRATSIIVCKFERK